MNEIGSNHFYFDENDAKEIYNSAIIEDCNSNLKVISFYFICMKAKYLIFLDRKRY